MSVWQILIEYRPAFFKGMVVTLELYGITSFAGLCLGGILGVLSARYPRVVGIPTIAISFVIAGMPVIVWLFFVHYPVQRALGIVADPFLTSCVVLGGVSIAAISDLVRRALLDFPTQYVTVARVCGLTTMKTLWRIQIPLLLRLIIPGFLFVQTVLLQATIFASLISVEELFRVAQRINATVYRPVEIYLALGFFFLAICLPINGLAFWLRARFTRDLSEI